MGNLNLKVKIAVLWLFMAVAYSAHMALSIFEPGVIELITDGEIQLSEGEFIFSALFAWLIPLTMAFLSVTLKDSANRWANIILGIILTAVNIFHLLFEQFTQPSFHMAQPSIHQLLLNISTVVVTGLIVWYAWKWPKQEG
jgi:positive regulator of sigma E activity